MTSVVNGRFGCMSPVNTLWSKHLHENARRGCIRPAGKNPSVRQAQDGNTAIPRVASHARCHLHDIPQREIQPSPLAQAINVKMGL